MFTRAFNPIRRFACLFLALFVAALPLQAEWNPFCLPLKNEQTKLILNRPGLNELEKQVLNFVQGSWCSQEKAKLIFELVVLTQPKVCVEIGAFTGSCTIPMLSALRYVGQGRGYIVDSWSSAESIRGLPQSDPNTPWWAQLDMQAIKNTYLHTINHWALKSYCETLAVPSRDALSKIPAIDFLHMDGNFSVQGALEDAENYVPKVNSGGYVLLSNALMMIDGKASKAKALWVLFDQCELIDEIDQGNTLLFRKN